MRVRISSVVAWILFACAAYQPPTEVARGEQAAFRGVGVESLSGDVQSRFYELIDVEVCPCAEAHSLGECLHVDHCAWARPAARKLVGLLDQGLSNAEAKELLLRRFGAKKPVEISLDKAPQLGAQGAPVILVEYSDFECPFCREFAPIAKEAVARAQGRARLYFKHYPLPRHLHAAEAARAATAAGRQGKFWEMHDRLFANQEQLERSDLEKHAQELGLDVDRFRRDMDDPATIEQVSADKNEGERVGVNGTPALFVNGRVFTDERTVEKLLEWVSDEAP